MLRWLTLSLVLAGSLQSATAQAADSLFEGPQREGKTQQQWLQDKLEWRKVTHLLNDINSDVYDDPRINWTRTSFVQPQVHMWDRYLYNETSHKFTVQRYLDDVTARYGGIDSVLLWPTYPNIGLDARSQWDLWRALPGGLEGLANVTREFHEAGVRVMWAYNPFDQGTRDEGEPHWTTMAKLLKETGGDGFNGDTMGTVYKDFYDAGMAIDHPIVGEAELGNYLHPWPRKQDYTWEGQGWNTNGWGYYFKGFYDGPGGSNTYWREPGVDKAKWLEPRGRRQTHACDRWAKDRHHTMQYAHFNGVGYESWENVWGVYNTMTDRDAEALRRAQTVWRWLGTSDFTSNFEEWEPYTTEVSGEGLYASRWKHANGTCAWTVVNRDEGSRMFDLQVNTSACAGTRLYDLFYGTEVGVTGQQLEIDGLGYGAYLLTSREWTPAGLAELLATMAPLAKRPLSSYETTWAPLQQQMHSTGDPPPADAHPEGTVLIPRTVFRFQTGGVQIEGGCDAAKDTADTGNCCTGGFNCPTDDPRCFDMCAFNNPENGGVDFQFPWESAPQRFHDATLDLGPFYMDRYPVTNAQFARYMLKSGGYEPRDSYNFLKHWLNATHPRPGDEQKPVVWVSLQEARDYCRWAGKRLPHAYEWQLAAQGTDGRTYPWGDVMNASLFPAPGHGHEVPELPDVGSFPQGDSPFNMSDAVGLVWQYTDYFEDDRTRAVLLKGSSIYNPVLSNEYPAYWQVGNWYFPQAKKLTQHNRLMLMDESYDRAGTLGFRCVADHPDGAPPPYNTHSTTPLHSMSLAATGIAALAECLRSGGARPSC